MAYIHLNDIEIRASDRVDSDKGEGDGNDHEDWRVEYGCVPRAQ
jgi:hypothetical protein